MRFGTPICRKNSFFKSEMEHSPLFFSSQFDSHITLLSNLHRPTLKPPSAPSLQQQLLKLHQQMHESNRVSNSISKQLIIHEQNQQLLP